MGLRVQRRSPRAVPGGAREPLADPAGGPPGSSGPPFEGTAPLPGPVGGARLEEVWARRLVSFPPQYERLRLPMPARFL